MTDPESEAPDVADAAGSPGPPVPCAGEAGAGPQRVRDLKVGMVLFDRFELIPAPGREDSLVGRGGMGIIHLAKDALLDRVVAIKLPPQNVVLDDAAKLDLLVETRQALALTHPNIVRVYDFHESPRDELWGISMQYVRGINLSEMRARLGQGSHARKPFAAERIRPWIRQICEALVHAHEFAGFVHRDLNPKNIMLEVRATPGEEQAREHILITDFGIAATIRHSLGQSGHESRRSWHGAGTLPYMPWDQIMGKRPSASDDIYALGATIFDLLTATPPFFEGPPDSILTQIERAIPPSMAERRRELNLATPDGIPAEWEDLVRDCLQKDPARRPGSVREVARRLGFDLPSRSSSPPPGDEPVQGTTSGAGGMPSTTGRYAQESDTRRSGRTYQSHRTQRLESKRLAVVMFTDIVGSVALQQRLGTAAYTNLVARHDLMIEAALRESDDAEVINETGDGFVVRFSEPSDAVQTALRVQFLAANTLVEGAPIGIRIGIHLGVITEMEERVRGETRRVGMVLNLAARVMDMARPGQILLTRAIFDDARQFVRTHPAIEGWSELPPVVWMVHGDFHFKGSDDPLALFEVGAEGVAPLMAPEDGAKGHRLAGSGSEQPIRSLPPPPSGSEDAMRSTGEPPSADQLKSDREHYESAHRELQAEIERLRESEAERDRELKAEAENLAKERARLESLSAELVERREREERASRNLREEAGNALREAERKSAELIASLAAEKANFEKDMALRAAEVEASALQRKQALEEQERGLQEDEKRLSEDRNARNDRSLELVRERERLKTEHHGFLRQMEEEKQRIEEERLAFVRAQEEDRARAEAEIERERTRLEASHAAALDQLRTTLAEQEAELRRQSEELALAEDRIRELREEERDPDRAKASLVSQLDEEARRFEARIRDLNADLEGIRRSQKRRITAIAIGSVVLALVVGMVSAKLVWGFWPWKLFTSAAETRPNVVIRGLKQFEAEKDWLGLLSASIPASLEVGGDGVAGEAEEVASLARHALHRLADSSERGWESDPSRLLECLEQIRDQGGELPPTHGFLMAKIRIAQARQSPRLAGIPDAVGAYLASRADPAGPELSAELDRDLNALQDDLLSRMEREDSLPDEADIQRALESLPEDARTRVPLTDLANGILLIRAQLRQHPPEFPAVLQGLERLESGDGSWKPRLQRAFEQVLAALEENPESLPSAEALISLSTRWNDPRALAIALENLEPTSEAFGVIARQLWKAFYLNRAPAADPLPEDSRAWIAWLAVNRIEDEHARKGLASLRELAEAGNAKGSYFLVDYHLKQPSESEEDAGPWKLLAENALAAGESGALVQLGEIHWRIGRAETRDDVAAASIAEARDYFRRAARESGRRSDRETAVIMLAGIFAERGARGIEERREMAECSLRAGVIFWRAGEVALAEMNWEKALEADPEVAGRIIEAELGDPQNGDSGALRDAWQTWRETQAATPPTSNP